MVGVSHPRVAPRAAHVFVEDLEALTLRDDDAHHLLRVLRLRDGEAISASDGRGRWRECVIRQGERVEPTGAISSSDRPAPPVTVGFALTKNDKPEFTVQKLCEVGVDRIVPIDAARSIVRWDAEKAARNVERWRTVARAAAMQARRVWLPDVADVQTLAGLQGPGVALAHPGGGLMGLDHPTVFVGPEGGWTDEEAAQFPDHVDLGPTTLRAETASLAVGVLLTALRDRRFPGRPLDSVGMPVSPE